jgi:glycerophosphoryl diester phosphodiesterase
VNPLARSPLLLPLAWVALIAAAACGPPEIAPLLAPLRTYTPAEPPAGSDPVAPQPPAAVLDWDDATFPVLIAHRGSGNIRAPENTYAAFEYAAALGVPIETDVLKTLDGVFVISHDDSTDRMCGTGGVRIPDTELTELLTLDCAQGYRPDIFSPQRMPQLEDVLARYGATHLLAPEIKPSAGPSAGTDAAQLIVEHGLQRSVLGYSFSPTYLQQMLAVDPTIRRVLISVYEISPTEVESNGLWGVAVSRFSATKAYIDSIHAAGAKVFVWTVNDVAAAESFVEYGADGIISDDPSYLGAFMNARTPTGTTVVTPPASLVFSKWRSQTSASPTFGTVVSEDGFVTWNGDSAPSAATFFRIEPGIRTADLPSSQTIATTLKITKGNVDTTRHLGIRFAWATDDDVDWYGNGTPNARQGYHFAYRLDGTVELVRDNGTRAGYVVLASRHCSAVAEGEAVPIRLDVTEATITATRTDTGCSITAADATYPRGGFVSVYGSGVVPGVGTTVVTY